MQYQWSRMRRRAGLPELRMHDLRHSFASFLVNRGISLYVVQDLLGHSSAKTTQRYAHLAPKTLSDAADTVAQLLDRAERAGDTSRTDRAEVSQTADAG